MSAFINGKEVHPEALWLVLAAQEELCRQLEAKTKAAPVLRKYVGNLAERVSKGSVKGGSAQ